MAPSTQVDKLKVDDPRVTRQYADINGRTWSYLDTHPPTKTTTKTTTTTTPKRTIILLHGFPDLSHAWRYQIPLFLSLDFRCIALDCMGYGRTGVSPTLRDYGFRAHADAVAGIVRAAGVRGRVVLGGHDWGGILVYRVAQWYPGLVGWVFSVCTAYVAPGLKFFSSEWLANTTLPQFGYQLQFGSEDGRVEKVVNGNEERMRRFLAGIYGGRVLEGGGGGGGGEGEKVFMDPKTGVDLEVLEKGRVGRSPLLDGEEFEFYVQEFMRNDFKGPLNWYRTRRINWEDEKELPEERRKIIPQPTLYILATQDSVLTREMSLGMEKVVPNLTRGEVPASHWALWQTPEQTNAIIKEWLEGVVLGGRSKL